MTTIRAAVCHEFGAPLSIEEVTLAAPGADEVEVAVEAVAICHSDISYADGAWGGALPAVYGHEAAGRVTAVGAGVRRLAVGDPVIVTLIRSCGQCPSCSGGHPVRCETPAADAGPLTRADGGPLVQGLSTAAFAEKVVVHRSQVAPIPDDMPMDVASLLACGVITGVGAVINSAGVRPGESVVVVGAGGVGLNAIQGAVIAGARQVIAVDLSEEKLDDARAFGATHGVLATDPKPHRSVREITGGRGADHVLVTVGAAQAYQDAPKFLAPGGTLVMVGMPPTGATVTYEPVVVAATSQVMRGSKMGDVVISRDIPWLVDLYKQGRLELDALISGRYPLDDINAAIADTRAGRARRNVIVLR